MPSRTRETFAVLMLQTTLLIAGCAMAAAGPIDVGSLNYVTLRHGSEITIQFSVLNYASNNPGSSAYPTSLDFQAAGPDLHSSVLGFVPGSSATWFTGYQLSGWLESLDGSTSLTLADPNANRLGMVAGSLVVTPGSLNGTNVALIGGSRVLTLAQSEAIFGDEGQAVIRLDNLGSDLTLGLGPDYTVRSAISEPNVRGPGLVTVSGVT